MARPEDVEILIHIAAPSRTSDDARYRSLAAAYLDFQARQRTDLSELNQTAISGEEVVLPNYSPERASGEILSSPKSLQASFQSVLDNANSQGRFQRPGLQTPRSRVSKSHNSLQDPSSWQTPPSIVQDSVPENDATTALLTTPTRVLEHYLQHFATPSQVSQPILRDQDIQGENEGIPPKGNCKNAISTHEGSRADFIPCTPVNRQPHKPLPKSLIIPRSQGSTQSMHSARQSPYNSQNLEVDDEIVEDTFIAFGPTTPQTTRADSEPPPSKRTRRDKSDASPGALLRTSSDIGLHNAPQSSTRSITFLPKLGEGYDTLVLTAPEPPVGHDTITPEDLITPGLAKLASDLKIPKRYQPEFCSRELRPFERGYWSIDCTDWPHDLKTEAWVFLANYVGTGVAGWGISCHRDERFTSLRLYCWGMLAAHIYFVAYLASRRRVCYSTTTWMDANGDTVVKMRKKEGVWLRY